MNEGITRIIRITNTKRLADRFLSVQIKDPDEPGLEKLGKIFALVEIESPLKENRQLGQAIINTLSRNYFEEDVKDPSEQFENAVKKVNQELYKIAKNGDCDWLGKINAILGLAVDGDIHFCTTGKVYAWVIRNQVENNILDDEEQILTPQKTFSHIVSGTLESKDTVILASSGLLELVSQSTLKGNIFGSDELLTSAIRFAQILRAKKGYWINGILIDFHSFADATELTRTKLPETIYVDSGSSFDFRILASDTLKITGKSSKRIGSILKSWGTSLKSFTLDTAIPANKKAISILKLIWQNGEEKIKAKINQTQLKIKENKQYPEKSKKQNDNNLIGKNLFAVNDYISKSKKIESSPFKNIRLSTYFATFVKSKIWKEKSFYLKLLTVVLIILLVFNLGSIITRQDTNNQSNTDLNNNFNALQEKYEEAKLAQTLKQVDVARDLANAIIKSVPNFNNTEFAPQANEILSKAEIILEELDSVQRLQLSSQIMEIAGGKKIVLSDSSVLVASNEEIAILNLKTKKGSSTEFTNSLVDILSKEKDFLIYSNNNINSIAQNLTISRKSTQGAWTQNGKAIEGFLENLYLLAPEENQIFKYTPSGSNYGAKINYITDSTKIPNAIDIAIDGKIYILNTDGTIQVFSKGKSSKFVLSGNKMTNAKSIKTSDKHDKIYILADNRINIFSKNGTYQKALSTNTLIDDFAVNTDENKIFILSEGKVFELNMQL